MVSLFRNKMITLFDRNYFKLVMTKLYSFVETFIVVYVPFENQFEAFEFEFGTRASLIGRLGRT